MHMCIMKYIKNFNVRVFIIAASVICSEIVVYSNAHGCDLKYKKHVEDRPNLYLVTNKLPGVCHIHADDASTTNYHEERKYPLQIRPESAIGGLNYDSRNNTLIYWSKIDNVDHSRLYKVRLNDSHWESVLDQDDDFRDVAYDWITKNLYVIMGVRNSMIVFNAEHRWNPTVVLYDRARLTSLAVHPNKGYLFFTETSFWYGLQNKIFRAHADGSNVVEFNRGSQENRYHIGGVVVDFYTDRVYWSMPGKNRIQHSNLDGQDMRTINGVKVYSGQSDLSSRSLAVDRHYVYYRSSESNSIKRLEKSTEVKDPDFELTNNEAAHINEIVNFSNKSQKIRFDHPCKDGQGDCEKYCFAVPVHGGALKRVCKCSFNDVLASDGVNCVRRKQPVAHY